MWIMDLEWMISYVERTSHSLFIYIYIYKLSHKDWVFLILNKEMENGAHENDA